MLSAQFASVTASSSVSVRALSLGKMNRHHWLTYVDSLRPEPFVRQLLREIEDHGSIEVFYAATDRQYGAYAVHDDTPSTTEGAHMEEIELADEEDGEVDRPKNSNLSNRLPREDFAIVIPYDDRAPLMERCKDVLGDRMGENRNGFLLDGKPANTDKIVAAAGLKFADEETVGRSPPQRRPKRRRKP